MRKTPEENKTVHCLGNGRACAYARGLDLFQLFGPDYSSPNAAQLLFEGGENIAFESERIPETAVWHHRVFDAGQPLGDITEFAAAAEPIILREIRFSRPARFRLDADAAAGFYKAPAETLGIPDFYFGEIPEDSPFYIYSFDRDRRRGFVRGRPLYFGFLAVGGAVLQSAKTRLEIEIADGALALFFSDSFAGLVELAQQIRQTPFEAFLRVALCFWTAASAERKQTTAAGALSKMCDDIFVLIKTQQSRSGGVLAGYPYHLAYLRDNYGVHRGLLAMGAFTEARSLLKFYIGVFEKYGAVHNAQGTDAFAFHIHECDQSEITGYLILMFLEYARATGDDSLFKRGKALLLWCVQQQHGVMRRGMLPFNGDETYIAGGILTREVISHGSMEATLLYHSACRGLLDAAGAVGLSPEQAALLRDDAGAIESSFAENFFIGGRLACNSPDYCKAGGLLPFRHGVRLCGHGLGLSFPDRFGRYVCPDCVDKAAGEAPEANRRYFIPSPLLMAAYTGSPLLAPYLGELAGRLHPENGGKITGYDPGLLLSLLKSRSEPAEELERLLLDLRDDAGAWSEYYVDRRPSGTMYRPWESGLNCEALLLSPEASR